MLNKIYQKRSLIVASLIAIVALVWVLSGLGKQDGVSSGGEQIAAESSTESALIPSVVVERRQAVKTWQRFDGSGEVEANRSVDIRSGLEARVVAINVQEGDKVSAGDALVELSPKQIPQQLQLAKARLEQMQLQYSSAKQLAARGMQNKLSVAEAKSAFEAAKADVAIAEVGVNELTLRAPFAGTVQAVDVELGDLIRLGERGVRLVQMDELLAVVAVTANVATQVVAGQEATVKDRRGHAYEAKVKYVSPEPSAQSRLYRVEVALNPEANALAIGQPVEIVLPLREVLAQQVAASLLWLNADDEMGVRTVGADNVVEFHIAEFLRSEGGELWLTGLPEQMDLIVKGQGLVRTGATVQPNLAAP